MTYPALAHLTCRFWVRTPPGKANTKVSHAAAAWLGENKFDFAFVYLGGTAIAGHAYGWMSDQYLAAISHADRCIAAILDEIPQNRTVLIAINHGGHDQTHRTDSAEDMTVPLIIHGPEISARGELNQSINIIDIAPTILELQQVARPTQWRGSPLIFATT